MSGQAGLKIVRFGDTHSYSDIATRRMFGDLAVVEVLENFDRCLEAAAMSRLVIAMLPVHNTANREISCADGVPVEERAEGMGLRVIATLELYVNHVLASFGRLG